MSPNVTCATRPTVYPGLDDMKPGECRAQYMIQVTARTVGCHGAVNSGPLHMCLASIPSTMIQYHNRIIRWLRMQPTPMPERDVSGDPPWVLRKAQPAMHGYLV